MKAQIAALGADVSPRIWRRWGAWDTYKIPILIAMAMPNFSFLFICRFMMTVQEKKAKHRSMTPENAASVYHVRPVLLSEL